jgi:hypothetical protein
MARPPAPRRVRIARAEIADRCSTSTTVVERRGEDRRATRAPRDDTEHTSPGQHRRDHREREPRACPTPTSATRGKPAGSMPRSASVPQTTTINPSAPPKDGEHHTLGQRLRATILPAPGAERGDVPVTSRVAAGCTRELQVRDVRARDEQHERDRSEKREQRRAARAPRSVRRERTRRWRSTRRCSHGTPEPCARDVSRRCSSSSLRQRHPVPAAARSRRGYRPSRRGIVRASNHVRHPEFRLHFREDRSTSTAAGSGNDSA